VVYCERRGSLVEREDPKVSSVSALHLRNHPHIGPRAGRLEISHISCTRRKHLWLSYGSAISLVASRVLIDIPRTARELVRLRYIRKSPSRFGVSLQMRPSASRRHGGRATSGHAGISICAARRIDW
jgi:hypothetical protein